MAFTSFDRMLYEEGKRRGYNDIQLATAIGNRRAESGGNPLSAVGDRNLGPGQEAFGGFQWRLDRQQRLRQSGDVNDPMTQVKFFFDELEGPESKAGGMLRGAQDEQSAQAAMQQYLRYKDAPGVTDKRRQLAQEAYQMITGGQLPAMSPQAMAGPGIMNQQAQPQDASYKESLLQGGPLALFGQGQQGYNWGDALLGVAASLSAPYSPQQAAVYAQMMSKPSRDNDRYSVTLDPKSGNMFKVDRQTGQVSTQQYTTPEGKPLSASAQKSFEGNDKIILERMAQIQEGNELRDLIRQGTLDPSVIARTEGEINNLMNKGTPQALAQARLSRFLMKNQNALLMDANGVQTEGDAQRALKQILGGTSQFSTDQVYQALGDTLKSFGPDIENRSRNTLRIIEQYKGFDPNGEVKQEWGTRLQSVKELLRKEDELHNNWWSKRQAGGAGAPGQSGPRDLSKYDKR